ncbi:conjugative transposon protein TraM [Chitinophaga sp. GbtcB8]|uniref:conjugative transposon protein TraM n=1 Tax=Chitinophaga sp. GbtcB8 TaxID=2824753 RepID=UPI001C2F6D7D|nr:conjugative transposon protein TraM [Chitinophaga sp. GbtcB8]
MENNESKRVSILVEDGDRNKDEEVSSNGGGSKFEKVKKPMIFALMAVVFIGCMYLIFKPSADKKKAEDAGLNGAVPQATNAGLQSDKQKACEQESLEQKDQEKRNALLSLSDYWNEDTVAGGNEAGQEQEPEDDIEYVRGSTPNYSRGNSALNSYRNAQGAINSFYQEEDSETKALRKELDELKEQLAEKDTPPPNNVESQLALMEKSYQMAAKYLPVGNNGTEPQKAATTEAAGAPGNQQEHFVAFTPAGKNVVSALYREPTDSAFVAGLDETRNRGFYTAGVTEKAIVPKNSIRACVQQTQVITGESGVKLRLLEPARMQGRTIPEGTVLTANAKFQNGRLQLKITSVEADGNISPVDITIYDLDGQQGLVVPYSPEMNALTEIAANMSQTTGSSVMMTRSAGQQVAGDLSRGLVQGISGYFSKKVRTLKVTLKGGHQVWLVAKN